MSTPATAALGTALTNAVAYGLAQGANRILSLLALPLFTRYLTPGEMGVIALLTLTGTVLRLIFGSSGAAAAGVVYYRSEDLQHRAGVIWALLALLGAGAVLMLAATAVGASSLGRALFQDADAYRAPLIIYVAALAIQTAVEPLLLQLQLTNQSRLYSQMQIAGVAASVAAALLFVGPLGLGVVGWAYGQLIGTMVMAVWICRAVVPSLGTPIVARAATRDLLKVGLPLVPGSLAVLVMTGSAPYFVARLSSLDAAGIFGVGYQLGLGITLATAALSQAWMPYFQSFASRQHDGSAIFPGLTTAYLVVMGVVALLFFSFAQPIVQVLAAPGYRDAWQVVGPVALSFMLMGFWGMLLPGMYFAAETGYVSLIQALSAAVTVGAHMLLIPRFGSAGASAAILTGMLALVLLQIAFNYRRGYSVHVVAMGRFGGLLCLLVASAAAIWSAWRTTGDWSAACAISTAVLTLYVVIGWVAAGPEMKRLIHRAL